MVRTWLRKFFCPLSYVVNISLSELQPPQLKTNSYVLFRSFLHVLLMWTLFWFFFLLLLLSFFSGSFFFPFLFFFLMLFVSVHKILILSSFSPNNFLFFFLH